MRGLLGTGIGWTELAAFLPEDWRGAPDRRRSATAASFAAALELVRAGRLELRQEGPFRPIWLRPATEGERMNETVRGFFGDGGFAIPPLPEQERMVEAVLFASREPLTGREIAERLPQGCDVAEALAGLRRRYDGRGVAARAASATPGPSAPPPTSAS